MGKRGAFAVIALILLSSILFSLVVFAQSEEKTVDIDPFVESALTVAPEVKVIIVLKEPDVVVSKDASSDEILEETKYAVDEVKAEFLENISEPVNEFGVASDETPINITQTYETINVVAATVTEAGLEELKNNPAVEQVILEPILHLGMIDTVPLINANDVHNLSVSGTNLNGTGMIACVLDSGIELNHSAFTGRILPGYDFINNDNSSDDDMSNSHGTHVSGSIAALTLNGTGIAPGAKLIPIKVCNATGSCSASAILSGIDYCNNLTSAYNISVLSMSISDGGQYTSGTCPTFFDSGLNTSVALGLIPVMASGNDGFTGGISYPACSPYTISVGSTTKVDAMSSFTNRGGDMLDILAPGSSIISTIRGNTVGVLSGTSMATPHVSGLVLLMQQNEQLNGRSALNISSIRSILKETGVPVSSWIRIDAYNVITKLNQNYTINNSAKSVSYQVGSEASRVTFDNSTDFSNFAQCSVLGASFVSINSSACPQFNKSASVRLEGIVASNVSPIKDGIFCGSNCTNVNLSGGILTFNVSSFSNYSYEVSNSSNSSGSNSSVMNVSGHYNLTGDFNGSIHLLADDIILDCQGFTISASSDAAIRADSRTNISIKNCNLTGTTDILFNGTSSSSVQNIEGNGSVMFINGDNNVIESAQISSNGTWISADASSTGNIFANLTIENGYGSIEWLDNLSVPSSTTANQTNLKIQQGQVSLNSSELGWMNETAQVTLLNLPGALSSAFSPFAALSQIPIIDENDDGTFSACPQSICNQTEYSGNSLTFVTQHFTTINSTTSFPVLINDSSTVTQNISVNGSAVTFNNNSITLDCLNNRITGNTSGTGVTATNRNNITIRNCVLIQFDNGVGITASNNTVIRDNFFTNSTTHGLRYIFSSQLSFNNSVINNTANRSGTIGLRVEGTQTNMTFSNNTVDNSLATGIQLNINNSVVINNTVISNISAIDLTTQNTIIIGNTGRSTVGQGLVLSGFSPQSSNNTLINNTLSSLNNYAIFLSSSTVQTTVVNSTLNGSRGIGILGSNMHSNTFNNTIIQANTTGLDLGAANASFFNTTIETNVSWIIFSGPTSISNVSFNQTTFTTVNGSIYIPGNFTYPNGTFLNKTNLNIILDKAFINASSASYLNQSAQITLVNSSLKFNPGGISVDPEDDGTFVKCPSNVCTFISQNSTQLIFNVTHFTSYSSNSTFPASVNESSNVTANVTVNGTAFIINASNIAFDCFGYTITGNGSGTGIDVTGQSNVTIKNCIVSNFNRNILFSSTNASFIINTTTYNSTQENIEFMSSNNNALTNITASGNASSFPTINLTGGQGNNLSNVTSSSIDTSGAGAIALDTGAQNNILRNISVTGQNSAIGILMSQSNNNSMINVTANTDGNAGIYIDSCNLTSISIGTLTGNSQPGILLSGVQNATLANLIINSSSGFGADIGNVQNSSFTNINFSSSSNEALRMGGAVNRNTFVNISASSPSNVAMRVMGSNNAFTNATLSSTSSVSLLVISSSMNNNFSNSQAFSSSGIGLSVSLNSNNNTFVNSTFTTNTLRAVNLVSGVQNNSFRNVTIFSNATWIHADADSPSNSFTNATFQSNFGSIRAFNFTMSNGSDVGTNNLSITQNNAFVNSSLLAFLNASSQIIINDALSRTVIFSLNDNGVFSVCNSPRCTFQSFNGSQVVFNVTSFTSYSTSQGGVNVTLSKTDSPDPVGAGQQLTYTINFSVTNGSAFNVTINETYPSGVVFNSSNPSPTVGNTSWDAGNLTANQTYQINITVNVSSNTTGTLTNIVNVTYANSSGSQFLINVTENTTVQLVFPLTITADFNLTQNSSVNGTAIIIGANNIVLDCAGFTLTGNGSGLGVNATARNNITIRNCIIANFSQDILLNLTNNSFVTNNSLFNASLENIEFLNSNNNLANALNGFSNSTSRPFFNISGGNNNTLTNMNYNATTQGLAMNSGTQNNTVANSTLRVPSGGIVIALFEDNNTFFNVTAISAAGSGSGMNIQGGSNNRVSFSNISSAFIGMAISINGDNNTIENSFVSGTSGGLQLTGLSPGFSVLNNLINNSNIQSASGNALQFGFNSSSNRVINSNMTSSSSSGVVFSQEASSNIVETSLINGATGVRFETNASNNNISNTTINDTPTWLVSDGNVNVNNTLLNVSFVTSEGSIKTFSAILPNSTTTSTTNLDITQNKAFINSTNVSYLNVSSQVALNSVAANVPYVDFNDDSIFNVCNPPQCVVESFNGSTAVFNVSSFTSYKTASSGNVSVTLSKGDSNNTVSPGDIFTYQINYTVTNGTSFNTTIQENYPSQIVFINATPAPNVSNNIWLAQNLTENSTFQINITVQVNNSVISSATANNTVNVSFTNSTGSIFNVNVSETTSIVVVFPVTITTNVTLPGNVTTNGSAFVFNTSNVTFNCNGSSVIDSGTGVAFNVANASNVSIINCRVEGFTSDVLLFNSTLINLVNTTLVTPTTWISADSNSNASLNNLSFENTQGSLTSLSPITVPSNSNINLVKVNVATLSKAFVNVSNLTFLNTSFRIRFNNLNLNNLSVIADLNDDNVFQLCADCSLVSFNGTTAIFDVTHFTTYSAVEGGVNFTITKTASPNNPTPGGQVTYTITFTVNSGFANNVTITENPPVELTFVSSTPVNTSADTWSLGNLSTGQSSQINVTYNISSNFTGTLNNTISSTFQNNTNNTIVSNTTTTNTVSTGGGGTSSGGGGGGSNAVICPPICSDPLNKDLAICRNNCPQPTEQIAAPVVFPEFPIAKESSSSEHVQEKESAEVKESVEKEPPVIEEVKSENENNKNSIVSSAAFKFGLPLILGIALLIFILSRIPRHPKDKFSSELKRNEERIKELERKLKN